MKIKNTEIPIEAGAHLLRIKAELDVRISRKYKAGQLEHGGLLCEKSVLHLLECAIDEAIDQLTYLLTIREVITRKEIED